MYLNNIYNALSYKAAKPMNMMQLVKEASVQHSRHSEQCGEMRHLGSASGIYAARGTRRYRGCRMPGDRVHRCDVCSHLGRARGRDLGFPGARRWSVWLGACSFTSWPVCGNVRMGE